ncbi:C6 zinc finger domain protein [Niveomyces insectorum RCEF 264]|uniref:C6 zinc finger domain protein n=1 Tax=Niveomyces insectorum RCEF 264 TaxID=1081102 RepID=A0A167T7C4_9HYPO|nr:C6 zinc finger domain protein [Niveomyces insectorum RCEF 264]
MQGLRADNRPGRVRRVKCDEAFPACRRCTSTGRNCDGYGILRGGGSMNYGHCDDETALLDNVVGTMTAAAAPRRAAELLRRAPTATTAWHVSHDEWACFDWFRCRTAMKLRGSFVTDFWTVRIVQAGLSEPAVFHAIVALGAYHRTSCGRPPSRSQELTHLTLQHYGHAIHALQRHFAAKDRFALRVTLLVCVVFVSLDLLRGLPVAAQVHLGNGLRLIEALHRHSGSKTAAAATDRTDKGVHEFPRPYGCVGPTDPLDLDGHLVQVLARLHVQNELFHQPRPKPSRFIVEWMASQAAPPPPWRLRDAWLALDCAFVALFCLQERLFERTRPAPCGPTRDASFNVEDEVRSIEARLASWLEDYNASASTLRRHGSVSAKKVDCLIRVYHALAGIMTKACRHYGDEGRFDDHTESFIPLVCQLVDLRAVSFPTSLENPSASTTDTILGGLPLSRSIVDMGWIFPLYYIAVKCRVRRLRLHAVRFLEITRHREGIWDPRITACVARKVMELEEESWYVDAADSDDGFALDSHPRACDVRLPTLPRERRFCDVQIVFSGEPLETVHIFGRRHDDDMANGVACIASLDVASQEWSSGTAI